jgi:hypothetical protein
MSDLNTLFQNGVKATPVGLTLMIEADLGTGATQACAGNDARLSDARTPTGHAGTHAPSGGDPLSGYETLTNKNAANGYCPLDSSGHVPTGNLPPATGLPAPAALGIDALSWVRRFKASALTPVADGTAISSWADAGGSGDAAVQATGGNQPVYKIAANGINGLPVVRFSGGQFLRTAAGGAALSGPFYMACVYRVGALNAFQMLLCFGNDSPNGERRGLLQFSNAATPPNAMTFNGQYADVNDPSEPALAVNAVHLFEVVSDGGLVTVYQDGAAVAAGAPPLASYAATPITIGADNGGGENATGDFAEIFLAAGLSPDHRAALWSYVGATYGLSLPTPAQGLALSGTNTRRTQIQQRSNALNIAGPVLVNALDNQGPAQLSGTPAPSTPLTEAALTVNGALVANCGAGGDHRLIANGPNNVLALQNLGNFSALRCLDASGNERMALGYAPSAFPPFGGSSGSAYWEISNFSDISKWGDCRIVQTQGNTHALRFRICDDTNAIEFYDLSGAVVFAVEPNGACRYQPRSTPPSGPVEGLEYYDSTLHKKRIYTGSAWETVTSA